VRTLPTTGPIFAAGQRGVESELSVTATRCNRCDGGPEAGLLRPLSRPARFVGYAFPLMRGGTGAGVNALSVAQRARMAVARPWRQEQQ